VHRDGMEAVARLRLGPAFEGAPRRAHGGTVAAIFDDVMGYVLVLHRTPAYTGQLTVRYHAPVPVGEEVTARARLQGRDGRKLRIGAEMLVGDAVVAEGQGVFVAIPPERLGIDPAAAAQ
jgi:acyl-coenzyme A thioesterase PaaI-like protein